MKYVFNASPNYRDTKISTDTIMRDLTIGLLVVFAFGLYNQYVTYGMDNVMHSLMMMGAAIVSVLVTEAIWALCLKKDLKNTLLHSYGWVTAIIFVLMCQSNLPIYVVVVCSVLAILFGKLLFGGFGHNIFNPAAVARAFVFASFAGKTVVDVVSKSTPTGTLANAGWLATSAENFNEFLTSFGGIGNMALGLYPGAIGETSALVIILVGLFLVVRRVIDWRVPVTYIVTLFVLALGLGLMQGQPLTYALYHVLTGGAMFGAVFMLTDPVTSPTSAGGRIFFAMGAAIVTFVIRIGASLPEGVLYSILIMNMLTPLIENLFDGVQIDDKKKNIRNNAILAVVGLVLMASMNALAAPVETTFGETGAFTVSLKDVADGSYTGKGQGMGGDVTVSFDVKGGKVTSLTIDASKETPGLGDTAAQTITDTVLASGDISFDTVVGATITSKAIQTGFETAIGGNGNASTSESETVATDLPEAENQTITIDLSAVADGEYTGSATGMGEVSVTVTVEGGKIASATVVGDGETEGLGSPVIDGAADQIVANQGEIEVVSGATVTSKAVNDALSSALAGGE